MRTLPAYRKTLLVTEARLLDIHPEAVLGGQTADGVDYPDRCMLLPAGVRVGVHHVTRPQHRTDPAEALDVSVRVLADLDLELREPGLLVLLRALGHQAGIAAGDHLEQPHAVLRLAAQQLPDRLPGRLAQNVPARRVQRGLGIGMPLEARIHAGVYHVELRRVLPDQIPRDSRDTGAGALGECRQIGWTQRACFAHTDHAFVGLDDHHGRIERLEGLAGPAVRALLQRQIHLVDRDARDLHRNKAPVNRDRRTMAEGHHARKTDGHSAGHHPNRRPVAAARADRHRPG